MAITLLLLGGGAFTAALTALPTRRDECEQARAALRPDAEEICSRAASSRSGSSSSTRSGFWAGSSSRSSGSAASTSSARGGFGSTAASSGG